MSLTFIPIPAYKDNYIWMLFNPENHAAVVVDPGEAAPVLEKLFREKIKLVGILITHHHWDHTNGVVGLLEHFKVPVYGPTQEAANVVTRPLKENDQVKIPEVNLDLKVLDIPGHTLGHLAYYNNEFVFTGDTLFTGGCGRIFEGTADQLYDSLSKLAALPENTKVYCGHEYTEQNLKFAMAVEPTNHALKQRIQNVAVLRAKNLPTVPSTILEEKQTNPFLRCTASSIIEPVEKQAQAKLENSVAVFASLRKWKDSFVA